MEPLNVHDEPYFLLQDASLLSQTAQKLVGLRIDGFSVY